MSIRELLVVELAAYEEGKNLMSTGDFERLLSDLQKDADLRGEFEALGADPDRWLLWANAKGYRFSRDEAASLGLNRDEISEDDLEKVAGGWCGNDTTVG
jgi:predicted ribosomally synthesized peptide with nif11-like leader